MSRQESGPVEATSSTAIAEPEEAPIAVLLRNRALGLPAHFVAAQGAAGVALSVAMAGFNPDRWGIAMLAGATVSAHALWSLAVQRTTSPVPQARGWSRLRRACAVFGTGSALALLFSSSIALLGHLQS